MSQSTRYYCNRCGQSIFHAHVNGQRVPLVFYLVVGQPEDTGPAPDLNAVALPQFMRELLALPTARLTLCVPCVAVVFRVPVVPAGAHVDPLDGIPQGADPLAALPAEADRATRAAGHAARAVAALELPAPAVAEASAIMSGTVGVGVPMADRAWAGAKPPADQGGAKRRGTAAKVPTRHAVTPWMQNLLQAVPLERAKLADDAPQRVTPGDVPTMAPSAPASPAGAP